MSAFDKIVGYEQVKRGLAQIADRPCGFRPSVLRLAHAEQVDEPVQIRLQVRGAHAGEAPQVTLEP